MPRLAGIATHGSGRGLLWNPYPAFTNAARDRLQLGVHVELREDVLHVGPHRVEHPREAQRALQAGGGLARHSSFARMFCTWVRTVLGDIFRVFATNSLS